MLTPSSHACKVRRYRQLAARPVSDRPRPRWRADRARRLVAARAEARAAVAADRLHRARCAAVLAAPGRSEAAARHPAGLHRTADRVRRDHRVDGRGPETGPCVRLAALAHHLAPVGDHDAAGHRCHYRHWRLADGPALGAGAARWCCTGADRPGSGRRRTGRTAEDGRRRRGSIRADFGGRPQRRAGVSVRPPGPGPGAPCVDPRAVAGGLVRAQRDLGDRRGDRCRLGDRTRLRLADLPRSGQVAAGADRGRPDRHRGNADRVRAGRDHRLLRLSRGVRGSAVVAAIAQATTTSTARCTISPIRSKGW